MTLREPPAHPWFSADRPRVLAHRGLVTAAAARDGVAENSFAAVAAAHAAGAEYVESDCHLTRDGTVVLFHDESLGRVTGDPRRVSEIDAAELGDLMSERGGLLALRDALEAFPTVRFSVDVKAAAAADGAGRIAADFADRMLLTSFSDRRRRRALAAVGTGPARPATSAGTGTIAAVLGALAVGAHRRATELMRGVDALQVPLRFRGVPVVTPRLLDAAHTARVEVHVWTINDPAVMRALLTAGVDGIVTDRADVALKVAAEPRR